jgi:hypothetical protein
LSAGIPTSEESRQQLQRIASSSSFGGSDPLRAMLFYLAEQALAKPGGPLKEYEIATKVLGRKDDFDPKIDSSVRVAASRLRSKLAEYYVDAGKRDNVIVNLQRGSYLLVFSYREGTESEPKPAESPALPAIAAHAPAPRRLVWICGVIAAALALVSFYVGQQSALSPTPKSMQIFWNSFLSNNDQPLLVYANPRFEGWPDTGMKLADPPSPQTAQFLNVMTGTGEVVAISDLARMFDRLHTKVKIKRAQLFTWDDAPASNLIFVGGQDQNPALAQLPKLEKFNFKPYSDEPFRHQGAVRNEKPAPGEERYYMAGSDLDNGVEYAIIALTRGISHDRRILIAAGTNTYGTEAAAKFLTDPTRLQELLERLNVKDKIPPFEALLRVRVQGGAPLEPHLVLTYLRSDR